MISRTGLMYILGGLLLGIGAGAAVLLLTRPVGRDQISRLTIGSQAPDFELDELSGGSISLSSKVGNPVVINFWASWCAPCVEEMPNIQSVFEKYPGEFDVLAVNAGETPDQIQQFVLDVGVKFPILMDQDGLVQNLYRIRGLPTTYIIDRDGVIRFQHIGLISKKNLTEYLNQLGVGN